MLVLNSLKTISLCIIQKQPLLSFLNHYSNKKDWNQEIKDGKIKVFNYLVNEKYFLKKGDMLTYNSQPFKEPIANKNFTIIYEDEFIVIINKPANLVVHPSGAYNKNTLTGIFNERKLLWHTVNRLDKETSGLMIIAKKKEYIFSLSTVLKNSCKIYWVLVYNKNNQDLFPNRLNVSMKLGKKENSLIHKKQGENILQGKDSVTFFKRYKSNKKYSLLAAFPKTGRTHQIRAHLKEKGFSVVGDKIYGKNEKYFLEFLEKGNSKDLLKALEINRQFLHASKITFFHPFKKKVMFVKAPLPIELLKFLQIIFP